MNERLKAADLQVKEGVMKEEGRKAKVIILSAWSECHPSFKVKVH